METKQRLLNSLRRVDEAIENRRIKTMERFWVQDTPKLHLFNYWFYRYFTNQFEIYILDAIKFEEIKKK